MMFGDWLVVGDVGGERVLFLVWVIGRMELYIEGESIGGGISLGWEIN